MSSLLSHQENCLKLFFPDSVIVIILAFSREFAGELISTFWTHDQCIYAQNRVRINNLFSLSTTVFWNSECISWYQWNNQLNQWKVSLDKIENVKDVWWTECSCLLLVRLKSGNLRAWTKSHQEVSLPPDCVKIFQTSDGVRCENYLGFSTEYIDVKLPFYIYTEQRGVLLPPLIECTKTHYDYSSKKDKQFISFKRCEILPLWISIDGVFTITSDDKLEYQSLQNLLGAEEEEELYKPRNFYLGQTGFRLCFEILGPEYLQVQVWIDYQNLLNVLLLKNNEKLNLQTLPGVVDSSDCFEISPKVLFSRENCLVLNLASHIVCWKKIVDKNFQPLIDLSEQPLFFWKESFWGGVIINWEVFVYQEGGCFQKMPSKTSLFETALGERRLVFNQETQTLFILDSCGRRLRVFM